MEKYVKIERQKLNCAFLTKKMTNEKVQEKLFTLFYYIIQHLSTPVHRKKWLIYQK